MANGTIGITVISPLYIPDVFTPNGDGQNDQWELRGLENYPEAQVLVFNRWGNLVFYGQGIFQKSFDGMGNGLLLSEGVYAYIIKTKPRGGFEFRGALLIIR